MFAERNCASVEKGCVSVEKGCVLVEKGCVCMFGKRILIRLYVWGKNTSIYVCWCACCCTRRYGKPINVLIRHFRLCISFISICPRSN